MKFKNMSLDKKIELEESIKWVKHSRGYWNRENIPIAIKNFIKVKGEFKKSELLFLHKQYNLPRYEIIIKIFKSFNNFSLIYNIKFKLNKYDKKEIINKINKIIQIYGPIKRSDLEWLNKRFDIPSIWVILYVFKTLDNFAKESNFVFKKTKKTFKKYTNKEIIQKIKKILKNKKQISKKKLVSLCEAYDICSLYIIRKQFSSVKNFVKELNIKLIITRQTNVKQYNIKKIIDKFKKIKNKIKNPITVKELYDICKKYNIPCVQTLQNKFKTWDNFTKHTQIVIKQPINNLEIIKKLQIAYEQYGPLRICDIKKVTQISKGQIKRRFNSLDEASLEAKIKWVKKISHNRLNDDEMIEEIKELYKIHGSFKKTDIDKLASFGSGTARKHFGTLEEMADQAKITFLSSRLNIKGHQGRKGNNEIQILDDLEKEHNIILERQKWFKGASGKNYYADAYHRETNTIYEVDENHHFIPSQILKDQIRENDIKTKFPVKFIRINEQQYLKKFDESITTIEDFGVMIND